MFFIKEYLCNACKVDQKTGTNLNKHLFDCCEYNNFMKTYIPPTGVICNFCNLIFIKKEYLLTHTCNKN